MSFLAKLAAVFAKAKAAVMATTATKVITATVVVAAAAGGTVGIVQADVFTSPEAIVEEAVLAMNETEPGAYEEVFGFTELFQAMKEKGMEAAVKMNIEELDGSELGLGDVTIPNVGFDLRYRGDFANKLHDALVDLKLANTSIISANVYVDAKEVQVAVPKLFEAVLSVDYSDSEFLNKLKESYLIEMAGIAPEDIEAIAESPLADMDFAAIMAAATEFQNKIMAMQADSFEELDYKKAGKEDVTSMEGEEITCKVYTADIPKEYIEEKLDLVMAELMIYMRTVMDSFDFESMGIDTAEYEEMFTEMETEMDAAFDELFSNMENIKVTYYLYKKHIVKQQVTWTLGAGETESAEGEAAEPAEGEADTTETAEVGMLEIIYPVEGSMYDNLEFTMILPIEGEETQKMHYVISTENTEEVYAIEYNATIEDENVVMAFTYEKVGGDYVALMSAEGVSIEIEGAIGELELGKSFGVELDSIRVTEGDFSEEVEIGLSVYVKVLDSVIEPLAEETKDVLTMTANDWNGLAMEIMMKIYSMVGEFEALFD